MRWRQASAPSNAHTTLYTQRMFCTPLATGLSSRTRSSVASPLRWAGAALPVVAGQRVRSPWPTDPPFVHTFSQWSPFGVAPRRMCTKSVRHRSRLCLPVARSAAPHADEIDERGQRACCAGRARLPARCPHCPQSWGSPAHARHAAPTPLLSVADAARGPYSTACSLIPYCLTSVGVVRWLNRGVKARPCRSPWYDCGEGAGIMGHARVLRPVWCRPALGHCAQVPTRGVRGYPSGACSGKADMLW